MTKKNDKGVVLKGGIQHDGLACNDHSERLIAIAKVLMRTRLGNRRRSIEAALALIPGYIPYR